MPVLAPLGAAAAALFSTVIVGSITVGSVLTTVALSAASFLLSKVTAPSMGGIAGASVEDPGQKLATQQATPTQRIILGRALVAGPMFFLECKPPFLYMGIILAAHEIDGVDEVRIGDKPVVLKPDGTANSAPYYAATDNYLKVSIRTGAPGQTIDPILAADFPELPASFKQQGYATAVLKMRYSLTSTDAATRADDHNRVWTNGTPQPKFLVRGAKVYDPRDPTQSASNSATWKFTDNASLCLAYYLTSTKGCRVEWADIDMDALKTAAAADDQIITLKDGTTERRYTVNGVISMDAEPVMVVQNLLTANLGRLVWRQGAYAILSGVPRSAVWTINDDTARGGMEVRYDRPRRELINTIRTRFIAPDREYQLCDGPILTNSTYLTADGEEHAITIDLPFTSSHTRAQRIAKATLERSRLGRVVSRRESIDAVRLSASDIVNIESGFLGQINGTYEINKVTLQHDTLECEIEAEEYSSSVFDWNAATDEQAFTIAPATLAGVN